MGKASSSKKVARAAVTGGGRTRQGARPWGWYTAIALVAALGVVTIVYSRIDRQAALNPLKSEKPRPPEASRKFPGDHWHAAYGIYVCNKWLPSIQSDRDPLGIHTHNDGVIHIHPFTRAASGRRATLGVFADAVGMSLNEDRFKVPGAGTFIEGEKCGDKRATVQIFLNGDERFGDPKDIRLRDRDAIIIAFAPEGTEIPPPPSLRQLDNLTDVPGSPTATSSTTQAPSQENTTPPTTAPAGPESQGAPAPGPSDTAPPVPTAPGAPPPSAP